MATVKTMLEIIIVIVLGGLFMGIMDEPAYADTQNATATVNSTGVAIEMLSPVEEENAETTTEDNAKHSTEDSHVDCYDNGFNCGENEALDNSKCDDFDRCDCTNWRKGYNDGCEQGFAEYVAIIHGHEHIAIIGETIDTCLCECAEVEEIAEESTEEPDEVVEEVVEDVETSEEVEEVE